MKYIYDGSGRFYSGLPARDLDDGELDKAQKATLATAVAAGVYMPAKAVTTDDRDKGSDSRSK